MPVNEVHKTKVFLATMIAKICVECKLFAFCAISESFYRAYAFYTKSDVSAGAPVQKYSSGLYYRKITIDDNLSVTWGSEQMVLDPDVYNSFGWNIAGDAVKLASNFFINII